MVDQGDPPARTAAIVKAEAVAALEALTNVLNAEEQLATAVVGIHAKATRPIEKWMRKLTMEVKLASRVKQMLLRPLTVDAPTWLANDLLQPFDYRPPQGDEVVCMAKKDFPAIGEWLDALSPPGKWGEFVRAEWVQRNLSGVFTVLQFPSGAEPLIAFTRWSGALLMKRGGITALLNQNMFELLDMSASIYLPDQIDFFSYAGMVFVLNWNNLERATSFREVTKATAAGHWGTFQAEVPLAEPLEIWSVVEKSVRHQNTINRAFSTAGRVAPSINRIEKFITDRKLSIKIVNGRLIIDPADREQVIHLITIIADGYVTSDLTDRHLRTMDAEEYSAPAGPA